MDEDDLRRLEAAIFRGLLDKHDALKNELTKLQEADPKGLRDEFVKYCLSMKDELAKRDTQIEKMKTQLAPILAAVSMVGGAALAWFVKSLGS